MRRACGGSWTKFCSAADAAYTQYGVGVSARVNNSVLFCFVYCWKRRRSIKLPAQTHTPHTHKHTPRHTHTLIDWSAQHPLDFLAIFPIDAIFVFISAAAKALKFNLAGKLIIIAPPRTMWVQPVSQSVHVSMRRCCCWPRGRLPFLPPAHYSLYSSTPSLRCVSHWAAAFKLFLCARLWRWFMFFHFRFMTF